MTDEEYVRANWEPGIRVRDWSAAAEFTRNRLEEIRQLREEIREMRDIYWLDWVSLFQKGPRTNVPAIISEIRAFRTLSRLERELAQLTKGMKEQP